MGHILNSGVGVGLTERGHVSKLEKGRRGQFRELVRQEQQCKALRGEPASHAPTAARGPEGPEQEQQDIRRRACMQGLCLLL